MIRFILERHEVDLHSGYDQRDLVTLDLEVPELQNLLIKGGRGEHGFEVWRLLGAEVVE